MLNPQTDFDGGTFNNEVTVMAIEWVKKKTKKKNTHIFYVLAGKKLSKQEDLKEMGDISSGMSSSIMQLYLKQVLEAFFHTQSSVRHFALNVIALTLNQGLIHPVQVS